MIHPFDVTRLKAASYKVAIGHIYIFWDGTGKKHIKRLAENDEFELEPNSIGFVQTKEVFRLPHYIGARFNLRITNVHRGILLGTGPLVDPGFAGHLLVPLHNLTTNRYPFRMDEDFAWFEFTKLSPNYWDETKHAELRTIYHLKGDYIPFDGNKTFVDPSHYLTKAWPGPIRSSIPEGFARSESNARNASRDAEKARRYSRNVAVAGGLAALIALSAVLLSSWLFVTELKDAQSSLRADLARVQWRLEDRLPRISGEVDTLVEAVDSLREQRVRRLEERQAELTSNVGAMPDTSTSRSIRAELEDLRAEVLEIQRQLNVSHPGR
jgi:deoxycytidine triphosphate deaminase